MASAKLLVLLHLSVLLITSFTSSTTNEALNFAQSPHYIYTGHPTPPTQPPTKPPTQPTKAPTPTRPAISLIHPPATAPTPPHKHHHHKPPKKLVAIQGVVYCKSCNYTGVDTLIGAFGLANATVELVCASTNYHMIQEATTNKNGYFYMLPPKLTTAGIDICKVILAKSPLAKCSVPTNLHNGLNGALLLPPPPPPHPPRVPPKYAIFTVGPFAYESAKKCY